MSNTSAIVAGIAFVTLAAANVVAMLEASQPSRSITTRTRLITVHRAGGYLFVILLCIMLYGMSQRFAGVGISGHLPTHLVLHIVLVLVLVPLLFLKILIARRYKQSHSSLKALGLAIFVISFALVSIPTFSELLRSANPGSLGLRLATALVVAVCLVQCASVFRKRKQPLASVESSGVPEIPARLTPLTNHKGSNGPMHLLLSKTEQQTHDTKTLRFQILDERRVCAKPGQFLTFQWTIDDQRVGRSYTVSSSPVHENYVEITPKRMENGCVSVFLNERAKPGLAVEASGPYGRFYFDETLHKSIVLIAAGSGGSNPAALTNHSLEFLCFLLLFVPGAALSVWIEGVRQGYCRQRGFHSLQCCRRLETNRDWLCREQIEVVVRGFHIEVAERQIHIPCKLR
jgi:Oxidoreductase FAD-binding domain